MITTIVRVECFEHHMGPYASFHRGSDQLDEHFECANMVGFQYGSGNTPTPESDAGIYRAMREGERCAFRDLEQASRWFRARMFQEMDVWIAPFSIPRQNLDHSWTTNVYYVGLRWVSLPQNVDDDDFILAVYEIDDQFLTVGECQVLAVWKHAKRIAMMSLETLEYLEV